MIKKKPAKGKPVAKSKSVAKPKPSPKVAKKPLAKKSAAKKATKAKPAKRAPKAPPKKNRVGRPRLDVATQNMRVSKTFAQVIESIANSATPPVSMVRAADMMLEQASAAQGKPIDLTRHPVYEGTPPPMVHNDHGKSDEPVVEVPPVEQLTYGGEPDDDRDPPHDDTLDNDDDDDDEGEGDEVD